MTNLDKYSRGAKSVDRCSNLSFICINFLSALFEFVLPAIVVMLLPASSACKLRVGCIAYLFLQPKFWLFALHKMLEAPGVDADVRAPNIEIELKSVMSLRCAVMTWTVRESTRNILLIPGV
jgi:hypothetical protein